MNMHIYSKINKVIFMVNRHLFNQLFSSNSNCLEIFVKKKLLNVTYFIKIAHNSFEMCEALLKGIDNFHLSKALA